MREWSAFVTVAVLTFAATWYCREMARRRVSPAPATWIIAATCMSIAFAGYFGTPDATWLGNITLLAGGVEIWVNLGFLIWFLHRDKKLKIAFDNLQVGCLVLSLGGLLAWRWIQPGSVFWLNQGLMVIAYVATILKVLKASKNVDSLVFWGSLAVASVFGSVPACMDGDVYAIVNSIRAFSSSGLLFLLLFFLDRRNGEFMVYHRHWLFKPVFGSVPQTA